MDARHPHWDVLGSSADTSLSKLLLADLAGESGGDVLEGYRHYLQNTFNLRLSHATLAGLDRGQLRRFFREDAPRENPMFLDVTESRHLAALDALYGVRLVVGRPPHTCALSTWTRVYDSRVQDRAHDAPPRSREAADDDAASDDDDDRAICEEERERGGGVDDGDHSYCLPTSGRRSDESDAKPARFYALQHCRSSRKTPSFWLLFRCQPGWARSELEKFDASADSFLVSHRREPASVYWTPPWEGGGSEGDRVCLVERVRLLLDPADATPLLPGARHDHDAVCATLTGFLSDPPAACRATGGRAFLLATHLGMKLRTRNVPHPDYQAFSVLLRATDRDLPPPPSASLPVILVDARGGLFLPHECYANVLRFPRLGKGQRSYPKHESLPGLDHPGQRQTGPPFAPATAVSQGFPDGDCCNPCKNSAAFRTNLADGGRQRLFRTRLSTYDCLHLLGLDTPRHLEAVSEACRLTSCSYDAESCTSETKSESAQPDLHCDFQPLGDAGRPRRVVGVQTPVFLGLTDTIDLDDDVPPEVLECVAGGHDGLVSDFVDSLLRRRDRAVTAKYGVLEPLFGVVARLRRGFFDFFEREDADAAGRRRRPPLHGPSSDALDAAVDVADEDETDCDFALGADDVGGAGREDDASGTEGEADGLSDADDSRREGLRELDGWAEDDGMEEEVDGSLTRLCGSSSNSRPSFSYRRDAGGGRRRSRRRGGGPDSGGRRVWASSSPPALKKSRRGRGSHDGQTSGASARLLRRRADGAGEEEETPDGLGQREARRRERQLASAWRNTVFGRLETTLTSLANAFVVWGFNCEGYDLPLMCANLCVHLQDRGLGRVRMQRDGTKVRWLRADSITFREVRRLLPAGSSLEKFRVMCGLAESKMIFPFDLLDASLSFLEAPELPPRAASWRSRLTGETPDQASVDEARTFFSDSGMTRVSQYLAHYLRQDVLMLAKGVDRLRVTYHDLLGIDLIDVGRATVSSLAALAAQRHLFLHKRVGMFAQDDRRVYSLLRQGLRGGLTAVYRTVAGKDADYADFVWLHRRQAEYEGRAEDRTDEEIERHLRGLNAHRLPPAQGDDPGPGRDAFLNYYDCVGLYSNAGE